MQIQEEEDVTLRFYSDASLSTLNNAQSIYNLVTFIVIILYQNFGL